MFKNVLVGVDGGANGRDAIALARQLTDANGKLTLAHIRDGQLHPSHAITPGMLEEEREASSEMLEAEREAAGVNAELVSIVAYNPGRGLHERAEETSADLIVVGSCSHGVIGRVMLGDDARAALNGAPCAVAIASAGYRQKSAPLARIGVAYNESTESKAALLLARELAATSGASVSVREVLTPPTMVGYTGIVPVLAGESLDVELQLATSRLRALPDVQASAVYGLTGEERAEFGDELDLLVVGSRGYGPVKRLVLGSTSNYLERHARCSLLVLPRQAVSPIEPSEARSARDQAPAAASV
jgi:nucleotide-binding universal stress UspA family protein